MFKTFMGPVEDERQRRLPAPGDGAGHLRQLPERADSRRARSSPFGIAQIGKSFRNEITPGNFIFRTREFEQMEMEFFVKPGEDEQWFEYWTQRAARLVRRATASGRENLRLRAARQPTSWRTTPRAAPTSSTASRSAGRSSRASPTAPTSICARTRRRAARISRYFDEETRERYLAVRDRAGGRRRPRHAGVPGRRLRRGRRRR